MNRRLREDIHAIIRLTLLVTTFLFYSWLGAWLFVHSDPAVVRSVAESRPLLALLLRLLNYARYAIVPMSAILFVLCVAGRFVQDMYGLLHFKSGLRFILSAMFAVLLPHLRIRRGQMQGSEWDLEALLIIGGPGSLLIQADTAVLFQRTRTPSEASTGSGYYMIPFECVDRVVSLEDQEGYRQRIQTVTRDGIQVYLTNVRFRYRILPAAADPANRVRSVQRPYPFSEDALRRIAYTAAATEEGEDAWHAMVARVVTGFITTFINEHTIDYLTAPREDGQAPRNRVNEGLNSAGSDRLRAVGAQLLWIDVGHIDIIDPAVDDDRVSYWAADWAGNARVQRAFADATQNAYRELGRAEAQADMIVGITDALQGLDLSAAPEDQLAAILLARTVQILEGIGDNHKDGDGRNETRR